MRRNEERYHNIFDYYRDREPSEVSEAKRTRAIENNLTKALLNVLEWGRSEVQTEFLTWLSEKTKHSFKPKGKLRFYYISKRPNENELQNAKVKLMLGVKPYWKPKYERKTHYKRAEKPRFDGVIVGREWIIAIESKTNSGLIKTQFQDEWRSLRSGAVRQIIDWRDIYDCFNKLLQKTEDGEKTLGLQSKLLLGQFCSYLESDTIKQVRFRGLDKKHFDFIEGKNNGDDDDIRVELLELMKALCTDLLHKLKLEGRSYTSSRVQGLRKTREKGDFAWVDFYSKGGKSGKRAYMEVSLDEGGMQVFVEVEKQALKQLLNRMKKYPRRFTKALSAKDREYYLGLYTYKDGTAEERLPPVFRPKEDHGILVSDFIKLTDGIKILSDRINELVISKDARYLHVSLTRFFTTDDVVKRFSGRLVKEIADTMIELTPFAYLIISRAKRNGKFTYSNCKKRR